MTPKEFFKRWGKGIQSIPPEELMRIKIYYGMIPSILGTTVAVALVIYYKTFWYIALAFGFTIIIQIVGLVEEWQKYKTLKSIQAQLEEVVKEPQGEQVWEK